LAFDRLIFACGHAATRPLMLAATEYDRELEKAGMEVEERRFRDRLQLAPILSIFVASISKKPLVESAGATA
jgi:hypothetical protein